MTHHLKSLFSSVAIGTVGTFLAWLYCAPSDNWCGIPQLFPNIWPILASWLPMILISLNIIVSNRDKEYVRLLSKFNLLDRVINNIGWCALGIAITCILLIFHSSSTNANQMLPWLLYACLVSLFTSLWMFGRVFYSVFLLSKGIANQRNNKQHGDG